MSGPLSPIHDPWVPDEFVVALPHLPVVLAELGKLPGPVIMPAPKESTILELALIAITNVDDLARRIDAQRGPGKRRPTEQIEYAIDRVIRAIRESCEEQYGGWVPTMGKNRMLDGIHATQHVGTGSAAYPSRASLTDLGDLTAGDPDGRAVVGLLDTPMWPHPRLTGRYQGDEPDIYLPPAEWQWHSAGHATFVAGLILQNSPNVDLLVRRTLGADGTARTWDVAEEMVRLAGQVDVLNVSFACFTDDDEEPMLLAKVVELITPTTVVVAAAGNFADMEPNGRYTPIKPTSPMWPAASERVVAVGAHDRDHNRASFSPDVSWVDLTARGVDVHSLYLEGTVRFQKYEQTEPPAPGQFEGYATWTGTSFASALASGAIARRIRRGPAGPTAQEALEQVKQVPVGDAGGVWRCPRPS
jgi:hypothetical protein